MAESIFPRALALSGGPFAKKVRLCNPLIFFRTGVIFSHLSGERRQARSQRRARDTPDGGGRRGGGGGGGVRGENNEF